MEGVPAASSLSDWSPTGQVQQAALKSAVVSARAPAEGAADTLPGGSLRMRCLKRDRLKEAIPLFYWAFYRALYRVSVLRGR